MPRGKFTRHKGRVRQFTSPDKLARAAEEEAAAKSRAEASDDEVDERPGCSQSRGRSELKSVGSTETTSSSDEIAEALENNRRARKGVAGLIEIENPNRGLKKLAQGASKLSIADEAQPEQTQLSARRTEYAEKPKGRGRQDKHQAVMRSAQVKADLARLAIIKQQREEAAAKREAEKKAAEAKKTASI